MDDQLTIEITLNGIELSFDTKLVSVGYTHKFYVMVNGTEVIFEPDEDRNYRAIVNDTSLSNLKDKNKAIIQAIGEKLNAIKSPENNF